VHQRCPRCAATNPASAQLCGQCWDQLDPPAADVPAGVGDNREHPTPPSGTLPLRGTSHREVRFSPAGPPGLVPAPVPAWPVPGWPPVPGAVPAQPLAGVLPRAGAYVVDGLILFAVVFLVGLTLGLAALAVPVVGSLLDSDLFGYAAYLLVAVAYGTLLVAGNGQTLAMMLFGLRVVRLDGSPPPPQPAFVRALVLTLLGLVPLGLVVCAVVMERDRRRQGWHDKAAGTLVVSTRAGHR
jgi:uncharacterized RDD family membrane protein YckC